MSEAQSGAVDRRLAAFPDFAALYPGYDTARRARGALRDRHERWERDAVDAIAAQTSAASADGEVVWS